MNEQLTNHNVTQYSSNIITIYLLEWHYEDLDRFLVQHLTMNLIPS